MNVFKRFCDYTLSDRIFLAFVNHYVQVEILKIRQYVFIVQHNICYSWSLFIFVFFVFGVFVCINCPHPSHLVGTKVKFDQEFFMAV